MKVTPESVALHFLLALVALAPWPLGLRLPWASMLAAGAAIGLAALILALRLAQGGELAWSPLFIPMTAFLVWAGLQWVLGWTIDPNATAYEWVRYLSYSAVFALTALVSRSSQARVLLARRIAVVGLVVGAFALVQYLGWNGHLYWFYDPPYEGIRFGPFNNRNYFAGYMLTALPVAIASVIHARLLRKTRTATFFVWIGCLSVLVSLSRAGIGALAVAGVLVLLSSQQQLSRKSWKRLVVVALILTGALLVAFLRLQREERIIERLESAPVGRLTMWRDASAMVFDRPIVGFGLNTFVWAFPQYDREPDSAFQTNAHNEFLEMTVETGLVGALICVWFLASFFQLARRRLACSIGHDRAIGVGAIGAWVGILVFGLTDFPTIIPAIDYNLAILAALAVTPVRMDSDGAA